MLTQKLAPRDARLDFTPGGSRGKDPALPGHLHRKVNRNVCPDNIWENQIGRRTDPVLGRCNVKISCPACAAKYSIADEKVQDRLAKIRCRKCGTTIVIDGKVQPVNIYAADGSAPAHSEPAANAHGEYSVDLGDNDQRTMTLRDVIDAYNAGTVTAETYLWTEGMADWKPLGEFPEIVEALHHAASQPRAAAPAPAAGGWNAEPAPAARAAARDTRRAGGG